jgi:hypothetical protein
LLPDFRFCRGLKQFVVLPDDMKIKFAVLVVENFADAALIDAIHGAGYFARIVLYPIGERRTSQKKEIVRRGECRDVAGRKQKVLSNEIPIKFQTVGRQNNLTRLR